MLPHTSWFVLLPPFKDRFGCAKGSGARWASEPSLYPPAFLCDMLGTVVITDDPDENDLLK